MTPLDRAIEKAGSVAALASAIHVATSAPSMWKKRGNVPAEHCPAIERATGVRCEDLRPDIPWCVLRLQAGQDTDAPKVSGAQAEADKTAAIARHLSEVGIPLDSAAPVTTEQFDRLKAACASASDV